MSRKEPLGHEPISEFEQFANAWRELFEAIATKLGLYKLCDWLAEKLK